MEIKIGVQHAQRELTVDVNESVEQIEKLVSDAINSGDGVFAITDTKGRRVVVPGAKVAYVEIGTGVAGMVGFRS